MNRIVYLNGRYLPESKASVSIFDRGFLLADAVYEVTPVLGGTFVDLDGHLQRLQRSLDALEIQNPLSDADWRSLHQTLIRDNQLEEGLIYLQVTRGTAPDRDFNFPKPEVTFPTVVAFTQSKPGFTSSPMLETGMKIISLDDLRWGRCDIKTTQLLYSALAKRLARKAGADDAWLVKDRYVTEGSSNNAYIIKDGTLFTRNTGEAILSGVTRNAVLRIAAASGLGIELRPFTIQEAQSADEAFLTSASTFVMPVVEIDRHPIGNGIPGPWTLQLRELYLGECRRSTI
jgi:D-alanine transaminase